MIHGALRCRQPNRVNRPSGFSLLEVVLAVALTAIIVSLIAGAIDFHLRQLTVRKTRIEEAQVARAVLRQIADDLRGVVVDRPIDFSSVQSLLSGASAGAGGSTTGSGSGTGGGTGSGTSGGSGGATGGGTGASSGTGNSSTTGSSSTGSSSTGASSTGSTGSGTEDATGDLVDSGVLPTTPGVYGNSYQLQIDVSRLPRYEEYALVTQAVDGMANPMLSDVKTVSYFLVTGVNGNQAMSSTSANSTSRTASNASSYGNSLANSTSVGMAPGQPTTGLARRVLDRAAARYSTQNADFSILDQQTELFAPEVVALEFRYFDGTQWLTAWDTEELGGVPLAVEIILVLSDPTALLDVRNSQQALAASANPLLTPDPEHTYRLVVHLPAGEVAATQDEAAAGSSPTGSSSTNASSSNSGGTGS